MRILALTVGLTVAARLLWRRQLTFEREIAELVADFQTETLGLIDTYVQAGEIAAEPVVNGNGSH